MGGNRTSRALASRVRAREGSLRKCYVVTLALIGFSSATQTQAAPPDQPIRLQGSDWAQRPSARDVEACQPAGTDIPDGPVLLTCRVGQTGRLEQCSTRLQDDPRLNAWGRCVSEKFRAHAKLAGKQVEVPIRWKTAD